MRWWSSGRRLASLLVAVSLVAPAGVQAAGEPYRVRHYDLQRLPWYERSHTGWHRLRLPPRPPVDGQGIPLSHEGGVLSYPVGELSLNGMRRLVLWHAACERPQLDQALRQAAVLRRLMRKRRGAWWLPHEFDFPRAFQRSPWYDAMAQGLALSFFVRLYEATGDGVHMEAAHRIFPSFLKLGRGRRPWVAYVDEARYLWLEHFPSHLGGHALNAHLHAVFGLYEYWLASGSPQARSVLEGAITTIEDNIERYRRPGAISLYDLVWRLQILKYHEIHIWQLRLLGRITGKRVFLRMADRLQRDRPSPRTWRGTPGYPPIPPRHRPEEGASGPVFACPPLLAVDRLPEAPASGGGQESGTSLPAEGTPEAAQEASCDVRPAADSPASSPLPSLAPSPLETCGVP